MSVIYRSIREDEEPQVLKLWTETFNEPDWSFISLTEAQASKRMAQTQVAVDDTGRIISAVHYLIRDIRGIDGTPQRVGAVCNVATEPDARRQGHSGKLLERAIDEMIVDGCVWSKLFTDVNSHYERYGWKTLETPYRQGGMAEEPGTSSNEWNVECVSDAVSEEQLRSMAEVYHIYNQSRPVSNVRTWKYWTVALQPRLSQPNCYRLLARKKGQSDLGGYGVIRTFGNVFDLNEIGCRPGCEDSIAAIMDEVRILALEQSFIGGRAYLPFEPVIDESLPRLLSDLFTGSHNYVMVRPLNNSMTQQDLEELFRVPSGRFWSVDDF